MGMIAIGGTIGTGLFLSSGGAISMAGPGGAMVAFLLFGFMVYVTMNSLGEMATMFPVSGPFEEYATRFVDPALGFALGWNYWYAWAVTIAVEIIAAASLMQLWFSTVPTTVWAIVFLALIFGLNVTSVKSYGESEFWFAGIKVATIVIFLIVGMLMMFGVIRSSSAGFSNWVLRSGNQQAPFVGGLPTLANVFLIVATIYLGTEVVALAAGESENPRENVPKAIKSVTSRILVFYICTIFIIATLIPFTDSNLLNPHGSIALSPFTILFKNGGLKSAASIMNAIIISAIVSNANAATYVASRMLYSMGKSNKAGKASGF